MTPAKPRRFVTLGLWLILAAAATTARAQTLPAPSPTPQGTLTRPTVLTYPSQPGAQPATDTAQPTYPTSIAGAQGLLVETVDGKVLYSQLADQGFNPASAVKLATALDALHTFGPQHRFITGVWTNGTLDRTTGTLTGDLIISGRDPSFRYQHAVMLARELNRMGVRTVTGDLVVAFGFTMNFDWSSQHSASLLYDTLDAARRPAVAARDWGEERAALGDAAGLRAVPGVTVAGRPRVQSVPGDARLLLVQRSSKLTDILKVLLCYSNNFMAERIGDTVGGPQGVQRFVTQQLGLRPGEVMLSSTSGLGVNRVTPRAMMKIYRALVDELAKSQLTPSDILPVAGVDPGTLKKRYTTDAERGSVIGKTGTLVRTDGGASALVGQMRTRGGTLYFVIFNQRGSVWRFRQNQDSLVSQIQSSRGGPAPFNYRPLTLAMRLADTEMDRAQPAAKDEYEPDN
ncbi:MAG TPA: D-alanyl-D-alanine carboxypeptidase [Pyrinomonadaceae bacterium]|jgi:D-alanyl-D-alanine carboxypeptidase/D-alanyl-D-alanine-endopeptidase (penicillin-binding protein 4)